MLVSFSSNNITGISFLMYNLANNEEVQEKCREEVMCVLADKSEVEWYVFVFYPYPLLRGPAIFYFLVF